MVSRTPFCIITNMFHTSITYIEKLVSRIGKLSSWLILLLILCVVVDVLLRRIDQSVTWMSDLQWHLFATLFLLGGAYTFQKDMHVRVDLFYNKFSAKDKALTNMIGIAVLLIPWCLVLMVYTFQFALSSILIWEGSPDPNGLPMRFIIKIIMFLGMVLLFLQAIASFLKQWLIYRSNS